MFSLTRSFSSRRALAAAAAAALTLVPLAPAAQADNLFSDGDGLTPVANADMSFGTVCAGSTTSKTVLLAVNRVGSGNVYANSATVTVSVGTVTGAGLSAQVSAVAGESTISLPSNWTGLTNNTLSADTATATVTLVAGAAGSFSGTVLFSGAGADSGGGTLTRTDDMGVTATVANCGDTTPPVLQLPTLPATEATSSAGAVVTFTATATDADPLNPTVTCTPASGSTFPLGSTTVNCSATDAAGNTGSGSFTVQVVDTTAPVVTPPSNITVEATGPSGAVVSYSGEAASDAVTSPLTATCTPASGSTFPLGTTTVTCSATDDAGNTGSASFTITVTDTTGPVLALPVLAATEATGPTGAVVTFTASASDVVDGDVAVVCTPPSGSTFPLGSTTVNCSATDAAGNTTTGSFTVAVADTTPPVVTPPDNVTQEATGPSGATVTYTGESATDIVDGSVSVNCVPASGSTFPLGTTTVTCSATDGFGNTGSATFLVAVVDTTPPALTLPADQLLEATGPGGAVATFVASATDLVDGSVSVTCTPPSGSTFPLGTNTVICSATDAAGNPASGSVTIAVQDTTPPTITVPADITAEATGPSGAAVTYSATATDIVDGPVSVSCVPSSASTFPLGGTTVNCSATDNAGNPSTASFTVTVQDTTGPVVTPPADITTGPTSASGAVVNYSGGSATDLVDGAVTPTCTPASGSAFGFGATTVTCSATDNSGNTGSATFTVTVTGFTFNGFFAPVDNLPTVNTVKGGSTVPLKWRLQGEGGVLITSTASVATGWPKAQQVSCTTTAPEDAIEETVSTGGTVLRYDSTAQQFIYNWQTQKKPGTCWRVDVKFADGTTKSALFKLK